MNKLKPIPNMANYTPRQLVGEAWEGDMLRWAIRTKKAYRMAELELEKANKQIAELKRLNDSHLRAFKKLTFKILPQSALNIVLKQLNKHQNEKI